MKLTRIALILNVLVLFSLYVTTINAVPPFRKRQDGINGNDFTTDIHRPFRPLAATKEPIIRDYTLTLSTAKLAPDGFERVVWTSNGQYPGPMIQANKGDRLLIYVNNTLNDNTTIHWHGIFQRGSTYYDGVAGQTQCVIRSGQTFLYNFTTGDQYGTYWWHSHYHYQYIDGLRGPLIIHDPQDPYLSEYDEEFVMTVSDWYHQEGRVLIEQFTQPGYSGFSPVPDAGLISGKGRYDCSKAPEGSTCTPNSPYSVYPVEQGKRYRFRIINTSAEAPFTVSIDEHPLRIIEVEGEHMQARIFNKINIAVGQRYSVIVNCDKEVKNFWIRATIVRECIHSSESTINANSALNYEVVGILRYSGAPEQDPTTQDWNETMLDCRDIDHNVLELYTPRPAPAPVTDSFVWEIDFAGDENDVLIGTINNSTFVADIDYPTVQKLMFGGAYIGKQLEADQNAFFYDTENGVVEIALINLSRSTHPFHLHGHNFYIMGSGSGKTPQPKTYDSNPSVRDTITVPGESWSVIRFPIDNPGVWAFHCHIEWHASIGMIGQLIERPSVLKEMQLPAGICP